MEFGFFNLDCMEGMKSLPDQSIDLAITDPPYGINIGQSSMGAGGGVAPHRNRSTANLRTRRGEQDLHPVRGSQKKNEFRGGQATIGGSKPFGKNQSGGDLLSHPKSIRRLMIAAHRTPHILTNCGGSLKK